MSAPAPIEVSVSGTLKWVRQSTVSIRFWSQLSISSIYVGRSCAFCSVVDDGTTISFRKYPAPIISDREEVKYV